MATRLQELQSHPLGGNVPETAIMLVKDNTTALYYEDYKITFQDFTSKLIRKTEVSQEPIVGQIPRLIAGADGTTPALPEMSAEYLLNVESRVPVGTDAVYGKLKLSASTSSTNGVTNGYAATPSAVKATYDAAAKRASNETVSGTWTFTGAPTVSNSLTVKHPTTNTDIYLDTIANKNGSLQWRREGTARWIMYKTSDEETGSNLGSNFSFSTYLDDSTTPSGVFSVSRSNQVLNFVKIPTTSAAQGSGASELTRRDYVDGIKTSLTNSKVNKAGDTMTGTLLVNKDGAGVTLKAVTTGVGTYLNGVDSAGASTWFFGQGSTSIPSTVAGDVQLYNYNGAYINLAADHVSFSKDPRTLVAQGGAAASLTRKDYVNAEDAKKLNLTGGTITGKLIIDVNEDAIRLVADATQPSYILSNVNGVSNWYVGKGSASNDDVAFNSYVHANSVTLKSDHIALAKDPRTSAAQGTNAASLTRKDYVDGGLNGKLSTTGTAAAATKVVLSNQSWGTQTSDFVTGSLSAPHGSGRTEFVNWIQWGHNGGSKYRHTLWCPADTSKTTELWFANQVNTTDTDGPATHWRVYHQGYKPTAAEVGAVNKAGDTMTGDLNLDLREIIVYGSESSNAAKGMTFKYPDGTVSGGFGWEWDGSANTEKGFHVGPYSAGYASNDGYFRAMAGGVLYANAANRIYHQGFKPTAADVGAAPSTGLRLSTEHYQTYSTTLDISGGGTVLVDLPANATDVLFRGWTDSTSTPTNFVSRAIKNSSDVWVVSHIYGSTGTSNHPAVIVGEDGLLYFTNLHSNAYTFTYVYQVAAQGGDSGSARPFEFENSVYTPFNKPTAADVGALPLTGGTLTGAVSGIAPTADAHLATKAYVDANSGGGGGAFSTIVDLVASFGIVYTNSYGKPLLITIYSSHRADNHSVECWVGSILASKSWISVNEGGTDGSGLSQTFVVPPGSTWQLIQGFGTSTTLEKATGWY